MGDGRSTEKTVTYTPNDDPEVARYRTPRGMLDSVWWLIRIFYSHTVYSKHSFK